MGKENLEGISMSLWEKENRNIKKYMGTRLERESITFSVSYIGTGRRNFMKWRRSRTGRKMRFSLWIQQRFRCLECGRLMYLPFWIFRNTDRMATFDHIRPLKFNGNNTPENLRLICRKCNWRKDHVGRKILARYYQKFARSRPFKLKRLL